MSQQPFNRFVNWFSIDVELDQIYKYVAQSVEITEPNEYFIRYNHEYYSLEKTLSHEVVDLDGELKRRCIDRLFKEKLKESGFKFKAKFIAFMPARPILTTYSDIFSAYKGFEYRVWGNIESENGYDRNMYLVVDPHLVFVMNANIEYLISKNRDFANLREQFVRISWEVGHHNEDQFAGIDAILRRITQKGQDFECDVVDARSGKTFLLPAHQVFLEPRPEVLNQILKKLGINTRTFDAIKFQRKETYLESITPSRDRFARSQEIINYLSDKIFPLKFCKKDVSISRNFVSIKGSSFPKFGRLVEQKLLFDKSDSSAVHTQPYSGLRTYGAFTKNKPEIKISLLGKKPSLIKLRKLVENLNNGTKLMSGGMPQFYNTFLEIVDEQMVEGNDQSAYIQAANSLAEKNYRQNPSDVVLFHLEEETLDFQLDTPYYNTKIALIKNQLASQAITEKTLQNLDWSYTNIANAIFAKAGCYPWVLAEDIKDFDMILGVGLSYAISKTSRAGSRPKFLSYTNVFDEQGRWMFFETTSQLYDANQPDIQLADLVRQAVQRYKVERGRLPSSIAIHYYQRFSKSKFDEINKVLKETIGEDFRVAYLNIDKSHSMRLYDLATPDGSYPRADYALLSESELLLCTTGFTDIAKRRIGTPAILKINIHQYPYRFVEAKDIASQVLALTKLNYKTMTPLIGEPVTLSFSNRVANFMANFSETQYYQALGTSKSELNQSNGKMNKVPWFL